MKKIVFLLLFACLSVYTFGQSEYGMPNFTNINFYPFLEARKIDSNFGLLAGGAGTITFSDQFLVGVYGVKNVTSSKSSIELYSTQKVNYEQVGIWIGGKFNLGAWKRKDSYMKRKTLFTYSLQAGGGRIYLSDAGDKGTKDYFYALRPMVGFERPIIRNLGIGINLGYQQCLRVQKYDYTNKDFSGLFANLYVKLSVFSKKRGFIYLPQ